MTTVNVTEIYVNCGWRNTFFPFSKLFQSMSVMWTRAIECSSFHIRSIIYLGSHNGSFPLLNNSGVFI